MNDLSTVEVLTGDLLTDDLRTKRIPALPKNISFSSMVLHQGSILLTGGFGNEESCLQLENGAWKEHSTLNEERIDHSAVTTNSATFLFGGINSSTYEYLTKDSSKWIMGKNKIPGGFERGCAISVKSEKEIWLIGGCWRNGKRIISFNVNDHTFQVLNSQLKIERSHQRCAFIPNTKKLMITGGFDNGGHLNSTEIIDTEDGSISMGSPMNHRRSSHGIGVVRNDNEERLVVFGGENSDAIELYNAETEKWEITDTKLREPKSDFGFLTVKLGQIQQL